MSAPDQAGVGDFWSEPADALMARLGTAPAGLGTDAVRARAGRRGGSALGDGAAVQPWRLLARQFGSPLVLILLFGAVISAGLGDWSDAIVIALIVGGSATLSFLQEFRASRAVAALRERLALTARVRRDGAEADVPVSELVPGDVVLLAAGNLVPGDGRVIEANDFLVTEASLTGESLPVEKSPGTVAADAPLAQRTNCVFLGGSVRSGTATVVLAALGRDTRYGAIAGHLAEAEGDTDFARGVRRFGGMLLRVMVLIVLGVLTVNQLLGRPIAESLLFAVALAVGLSPELLPAIVTVTLSAGARHLARGGVIVRRLEALENLGSMTVLCTDKTGTLTEGCVSLAGAIDAGGAPCDRVRDAGFINAHFETGIANPLDAALVAAAETAGWRDGGTKLGEVPYDFRRRRLSIVVAADAPGQARIVTKGAYADVLAVCTHLVDPGADRGAGDGAGPACVPLTPERRAALDALFEAQGAAGYRALAVAERIVPDQPRWTRADETAMCFLGLLLFLDPPKAGAAGALADLAALGIAVKVISGDNRHVTAHVAAAVGLDPDAMLTGPEVAAMSDAALQHHAAETRIFAEIDPEQKHRIVRALQARGASVGFLGDGINDAPALRAADVGISVDQAVDVARESADVVLLRRDLDVLRQGVEDGRRTFANTLKYIAIATSANFGNMVSMALVTPLLPFLPLLPKQILLNNFLSDLPSIAIAGDRIDPEQQAEPQRWDVRAVGRFMLIFGLLSSVFDGITFAVLLTLVGAQAGPFQTSWFVISVLTELAVLFVLRTHRPAWRSRPSGVLAGAAIVTGLIAMLLPFSGPVARALGLVPLPPVLYLCAVAIVLGYVASTELAKRFVFRGAGRPKGPGAAPGREPSA